MADLTLQQRADAEAFAGPDTFQLTPRQVADRRAALKASTALQEQHKAAMGPFEIDRDTPDRDRIERACREERQIDVMQGRP